MGISYDDAARLGLERHHPDHPGNAVPAKLASKGRRPRITGKNDKGQNKTEARFDEHLSHLVKAGEILEYQFEPIKFRIGPKTFLTIDFAVYFWDADVNMPVFIDVKGGPIEDDASVKLKVAAERFQQLGDFWVVREVRRGEWSSQQVHPVSGFCKAIPGDAWLMGVSR